MNATQAPVFYSGERHEVLMLDPEVKVVIAVLVLTLFLAGIVLKLRMFRYLIRQGLKRPVNVIIFSSQCVNSGELIQRLIYGSSTTVLPAS